MGLYEGIKLAERDGPNVADPDEPLVKVYMRIFRRICEIKRF